MVAISENTIGVDFTQVWQAGMFKVRPFKTGQNVRGDDGSLYQFARATGAIGASATTVTIAQAGDEYTATSGGGTAENASGVALVADDHAWFKLA